MKAPPTVRAGCATLAGRVEYKIQNIGTQEISAQSVLDLISFIETEAQKIIAIEKQNYRSKAHLEDLEKISSKYVKRLQNILNRQINQLLFDDQRVAQDQEYLNSCLVLIKAKVNQAYNSIWL